MLGASCNAQDAPGDTSKMLAPVVVTATRTEQSSFDLPLSIDRIDASAIRSGTALINLSESLQRVPGIVVQNRQNYAQDVQISSRGFGARSTFGVRGLRLYVDGIPATMPDGQGQTSNIDLNSAESIEILRGPFSALYGNSSGGVISIVSEEGGPGQALSPFFRAGSYGTQHSGIKLGGRRNNLSYLLNASHFSTDGYREHSAASRDLLNAKIRQAIGDDVSLTLVGNSVSLREVQDPLGLTRSQFEASPRSADTRAISFNTRKSVRQQQLGLNFEKFLSAEDTITAIVYGGQRSTLQYLAVPVAAQIPPTSAGGVIDLSRRYGGTDVRWSRTRTVDDQKFQWTLGISYDDLREDRRGFENFDGGMLGVRGRLRRDEQNRAYNVDQYVQLQWEPTPRWLLMAGLRNSRVRIDTDDAYVAPGNADDSGSTTYNSLNPVLGATFKLSDAANIYVSYGKGFETPTLNELSYSNASDAAGGGGGFNFGLRPAKSQNVEAGVKLLVSPHVKASLAAFHIATKDELAVLSSSGGRAVYQNIGKTRRSGMEMALQGEWPSGLGMLLSYSFLRAEYAEAFCNGPCSPDSRVAAGNRVPGVPGSSAYGELSWRHPRLGMTVALEGRYVGKVYVNDVNDDAAPAYATANARIGFEQKAGQWTFSEFARIDNISDKQYAGSVIVNEGNRRFFEPAPGRNYLFGINASYTW